MSWQRFGGTSARLSRTGIRTCVTRQELQVSSVRPPARVIEYEDRQHRTTDAVDGLDTGQCRSANECEQPVALRSDSR